MSSTAREEPGLIGWLGTAISVAVFVLVGYNIYSTFKGRPAMVSLSAYFVSNPATSKDPSGSHLKIQGEISQSGETVKDGKVRLTANKQDHSFQQAVSVDLKNGKFETEDPAFFALNPDDQVYITAEIWASNLSGTATRGIYLNSGPPALGLTGEIIVWVIIGILISIFFYSFTGKKTPAKNRTAIILSYIIIGISLAVPLLAPVLLLRAFPNLRSAMIGKPAGLVVTRIGKEPGEAQWAVNIGGYSTIMKSETASESSTSANKSEDTIAARNPSTQEGTKQTANPAGPAGTVPTVPAPTGPPLANPVSTPTSSSPDTGGAVAEKRALKRPNSGAPKDTRKEEEVLKVEGGLVIPLYVIILSVIGGAINMTRKVPRLQREGEYAEVSGPPPMGKLETKVVSVVTYPFSKSPQSGKSGSASEVQGEDSPVSNESDTQTSKAQAEAIEDAKPTPEAVPSQQEQAVPELTAQDIDAKLDLLVKNQVQRNGETDHGMRDILALVQKMRNSFDSRKDSDPILGFDSFEDWLRNRSSLRELLGSNWRVELLNQYMYLISAPFLAIVSYYMLDMLGLTKQPVLVLISFSVGLISERIVSWLLGMATGYLRTDTASQPTGT